MPQPTRSEIETGAKNQVQAAAHLDTALQLADLGEAPFERSLTLLALARLKLAQGEPAAQVDLEALDHLAVRPGHELALQPDVGHLRAGAGVRAAVDVDS